MANIILGVFCPLAIIFAVFVPVKGQPITKEDADSLLPQTPKTKNETVAALVQDAVVQQAVQSVVGDGSLSGLVVKKNTVILPVNAPDVVLSHNEQILEAPLNDLENIRKNITETAAALYDNENSAVTKIDEISLGEIIPLNEDNSTLLVSGATPSLTRNAGIEVPENITTNLSGKEPEKIFTQSLILSGLIGDKISEIGLSKEGKRATLSSSSSSSSGESSLEKSSSSLEENNEEFENNYSSEESSSSESREESLEFGARIPVLPVIIDDQYNPSPAVKIETINASAVNEEIQSDVLIGRKKNLIAIFTPGDEGLDYQNRELEDMAAAEDIIFRPLFRYREQQNERTRILENRAYQRLGYKYNNRKDNYRRRRPYYYSDDNYNYNKRPQRTKYYDDYN